MYSATYSPEDNKLRLYAAMRLPADVYARVKAAGFIWAAKQDLFVAPMWTPEREDLLIELAGEIGDEDTSLVDRAEDRADRFDGYRDNRAEDAERARQAVAAIADNIPLGQPILVGHHSERHARKDAERIQNGMRKAIKMWETSKYWQARAQGAIRHAKYKERPDVRARRIKTLEADKRRQERYRDEARKFIKLWGQLNRPHRGTELRPGVYAQDGLPCDDVLRLKRALAIANYSHISLPATPERPYGTSLWGALNDSAITPRQAQLFALKAHARMIAQARRWIAHVDNRLLYERAMLEEQGGTDLLKPKGKSAKAQLPLCNYRAPEGLDIENMYNRGEMIHYPQIEMTAAEYTRIHTDYKGTRVVGNSHRVRTTMQKCSLVCVFLTDSKVHEPPANRQAAERPVRVPRVQTEPRPVDPQAEVFDAMKASVKAGVTVVSAPQLFPTPEPIAERVIELADIQPGHAVLEPSAGTGALLGKVIDVSDRGGPVPIAVEINSGLADRLRQRFPLASVRCADFLTCNGDLGTFDRIVMNPPFRNAEDIKHIEHARRMLRPGGRLVAVCAAGPRQREAFADHEWIDLPAGSFAAQGTGVNAAIVVIDADER